MSVCLCNFFLLIMKLLCIYMKKLVLMLTLMFTRYLHIPRSGSVLISPLVRFSDMQMFLRGKVHWHTRKIIYKQCDSEQVSFNSYTIQYTYINIANKNIVFFLPAWPNLHFIFANMYNLSKCLHLASNFYLS